MTSLCSLSNGLFVSSIYHKEEVKVCYDSGCSSWCLCVLNHGGQIPPSDPWQLLISLVIA